MFLVFLLLLGMLCIYIDVKLRGVARNFAESRMAAMLTSAVNKAASRLLEEYEITYDKVSEVTRDQNGNVTSIEIDTNEINRFKSSLTEEVLTELRSYGSVGFSVPVSAAFGIYYSYLYYPRVSYNMTTAVAVSSDFESEFTDAGINQVLHRISVVVGTKGSLAIPGEDEEIEYKTSFTVAQTVIVGAVPDAYTSIDYASEDTVDDIFDYQAQLNE